jgi:dTMP kinase
MKPGRLITLEGGEGAGKSTSIAFICEYLRNAGRQVVSTREPGGTTLGEKIRELLLNGHEDPCADTELLLIFAARAEHIHRVIRPALEHGVDVVCDRFTDATYAYQGGGRGVPIGRIHTLEDWVQNGLRPDLTLLLDIPVDEGLARAGNRSAPDRFEREQQSFFERVRHSYLQAAAREPGRIRIINAALGISEVQGQLQAALDTILS